MLIVYFQQLIYTSAGSYTDQEHMTVTMDLFQQLFLTSLGSSTLKQRFQ